jgi:hypothetical protein
VSGQLRLRPESDSAPRSRSESELRAMTDQAWELRAAGSPYFVDAVEAIVEWHERRHLRRFERRQQDLVDLKRLLRETDPGRASSRRAA